MADLGYGAGIPATRELAGHGLRVIGVDLSAVQLARARRLVQADLTALRLRPASLDAVVSFYAPIHVPLADQHDPFPRFRGWLRRVATCWRSPARAAAPRPSPTSAPRCSGTTPTLPLTCAGCRQPGSHQSGTRYIPNETPGTASSWPALANGRTLALRHERAFSVRTALHKYARLATAC